MRAAEATKRGANAGYRGRTAIAVLAALAVLLAGFIALVEMIYHSKSAAAGTSLELFGLALEVGTARPWVMALLACFLGLGLLAAALRPVRRAWAQVNAAVQASEGQA